MNIYKALTKKIVRTNQQIQTAELKINIQKSVAFLYTNNKMSEKEIKRTIPFIIATKPIKYLGINLTKKVKDMFSEKYNILMREIEEDKNK